MVSSARWGSRVQRSAGCPDGYYRHGDGEAQIEAGYVTVHLVGFVESYRNQSILRIDVEVVIVLSAPSGVSI